MHNLTRVSLLSALIAAWSLGACASPPVGAQRTPAGPSEVVAELGDRQITLQELDERALSADAGRFQGMQLRQALYEARRAALNELLRDLLLDREAASRGVSREELITQITADVPEVTQADVERWYAENQRRVGGAPLAEVGDAIKGLLVEMRRREVVETLIGSLRQGVPLRVSLEPPRLAVQVTDQDPSLGNADAPIQIVEFSDFQCPYCAAAVPTIKQVLEKYGDRVRLTFRNFPLSNHADAFKAAEAAQCASDQGRFWEYHDLLFERRAQGMKSDQLKGYAGELGLDVTRFTECLDEARHETKVQGDLRDGQSYGVSATPTFYINGRVLTGAQPLDEFVRIIDEELAGAPDAP